MSDQRERDDLICRLRDDGLTLRDVASALARERADWTLSLGAISRVCKARGRAARPTRSDAGATRRPRLTRAQEEAVVAILMGLSPVARPGAARPTSISTAMAIREAEHQGLIPAGACTVGWLNRRLRTRYNLHRRGPEARRTGPTVVRRFQAPRAGALYQFDGTLAQSFYIDASGDFTYLPGTELKEQLKVAGKTRAYVLAAIDDYSRCLRLYACDGETGRHVVGFLRTLLCRTDDPMRPMCGVPSALYSDNGSALASATATRVLDAFGVRGRPRHRPRSPWSKGKIERAFHATSGYQELTRGRRIRSFVEFAGFLRDVEIEMNSRVHGSTGEIPAVRFARSAAESAAAGAWRYAADDDALWRRLSMVRLDSLRVRADLTVALGRGERLALPHEPVYAGWIGQAITVYLDAAPGEPVREGQTCVVVDPSMREEYTIERRGPILSRSLVGRPPVTTARDDLIARARDASAMIDDDARGRWIGSGAVTHAMPDAPVVSPAAGAAAPAPTAALTRHEAVGALMDMGLYDGRDAGDRAMIDALMAGADTIERARLDHLIDHGRLPEDAAPDAQEDAA